MSDKPYLSLKFLVRKCIIATMNYIFTGYKVHLFEIIGNMIDNTKCATFPYPTFF